MSSPKLAHLHAFFLAWPCKNRFISWLVWYFNISFNWIVKYKNSDRNTESIQIISAAEKNSNRLHIVPQTNWFYSVWNETFWFDIKFTVYWCVINLCAKTLKFDCVLSVSQIREIVCNIHLKCNKAGSYQNWNDALKWNHEMIFTYLNTEVSFPLKLISVISEPNTQYSDRCDLIMLHLNHSSNCWKESKASISKNRKHFLLWILFCNGLAFKPFILKARGSYCIPIVLNVKIDINKSHTIFP